MAISLRLPSLSSISVRTSTRMIGPTQQPSCLIGSALGAADQEGPKFPQPLFFFTKPIPYEIADSEKIMRRVRYASGWQLRKSIMKNQSAIQLLSFVINTDLKNKLLLNFTHDRRYHNHDFFVKSRSAVQLCIIVTEGKVDENTIHCDYICKNTKTRKEREKKKKKSRNA